jgi:hypothetical protein
VHFRRLSLRVFVEKPRRSTTAPAFLPQIQQNGILLLWRPGASCKNAYTFLLEIEFQPQPHLFRQCKCGREDLLRYSFDARGKMKE